MENPEVFRKNFFAFSVQVSVYSALKKMGLAICLQFEMRKTNVPRQAGIRSCWFFGVFHDFVRIIPLFYPKTMRKTRVFFVFLAGFSLRSSIFPGRDKLLDENRTGIPSVPIPFKALKRFGFC